MSGLVVDIRRRIGDFTLSAAFEAPAGVTAVLGRSGAGKSTLVAAIAGLVRPDAGRITLDDAVLYDGRAGKNLAVRERRVGVVFQESRLFPHLSVRSNLLFGARRRRGAAGPSFDQIVETLGVGALLDRRPRSLSGGERQRIAIGRALLSGPRALLFDEPLAALDSERKAEVLPFLEALTRATALPVLYVTHALEEARRLADRLVVLEAGGVAAAGPVEAAIAQAGLATAGDRFADGVTVEAVIAELDDRYELTGVALGAHRLWVVGLLGAPGEAVRLRLLARDVALALDPPTRISTRNILPGLVRSVRRDAGPYVTVAVDVGGAVLKSEITARAADELGLAPGRPVHALIKSVATMRV